MRLLFVLSLILPGPQILIYIVLWVIVPEEGWPSRRWPLAEVLVAGGSIGGLTTAVLLRDLGCEVDVYERAGAALEDRGAGIVVLPVTEKYFTSKEAHNQRSAST